MNRRLIFLSKLLLAAALVAWLLRSGQLDFSSLSNLGNGWPCLLLAQVPFAFMFILSAWRLALLLRILDIPSSFASACSLTLIGWFFSQVLVGTTGGDVLKACLISGAAPGARGRAALTVILDRALGLVVLLGFAAIAIPFNLRLISSQSGLGGVALVLALTFGFAVLASAILYWRVRRSRLRALDPASRRGGRSVLLSVRAVLRRFSDHRRETAHCILATVALQLCVILTNLALASALMEARPSLASFFFVVPLAHTLMALPLNPPSALGTGEAAFGCLFGILGIEGGAFLCVLQRLVYFAWALPGACLYLGRRPASSAHQAGARVPGRHSLKSEQRSSALHGAW